MGHLPQDELAAFRSANAWLREVIEAKDEMLAVRDARIAVLARQVESLTERVAELERRLGRRIRPARLPRTARMQPR